MSTGKNVSCGYSNQTLLTSTKTNATIKNTK